MDNDEQGLSAVEKMRLGVTSGERREVINNQTVDTKALKKPYERIAGASKEEQEFLRNHRIDG